jgi:hypothetical protein
MKPFLLHFSSDAHETIVPTLTFDEKLSLNIVCDTGAPFASTKSHWARVIKAATVSFLPVECRQNIGVLSSDTL